MRGRGLRAARAPRDSAPCTGSRASAGVVPLRRLKWFGCSILLLVLADVCPGARQRHLLVLRDQLAAAKQVMLVHAAADVMVDGFVMSTSPVRRRCTTSGS